MAFIGLGKWYRGFRRTNEFDESIVGVPFVTAPFARVEDCAALICGTELLRVVSDLFLSAALAGVLDDGRSLHIIFGQGLDI